jgi:hypothetical protein
MVMVPRPTGRSSSKPNSTVEYLTLKDIVTALRGPPAPAALLANSTEEMASSLACIDTLLVACCQRRVRRRRERE